MIRRRRRLIALGRLISELRRAQSRQRIALLLILATQVVCSSVRFTLFSQICVDIVKVYKLCVCVLACMCVCVCNMRTCVVCVYVCTCVCVCV